MTDFETKGYVIHPGVLSPEQCEKFIALASEKGKADDHPDATRNFYKYVGVTDFPELTQICHELVSQTVGRTVSLAPQFVYYNRPPGAPPLYWHRDDDGGDPANMQRITAMVYLDGTKPENGCLRVIPGSHLKREDEEFEALIVEYRKLFMANEQLDEPGRFAPCFEPRPNDVDVVAPAGSIVICNEATLHGTHANTSENERPMLLLWTWYMK